MQSGLYAAFLSAFLINTLGRLEENPLDTIRDALVHQTRMMRNATLGPFEPQPFKPSHNVVVVNILLFVSLVIILIGAFVSMLVKGWIRELDRGLKSIPAMKDRATVREYRTQGFERYRLPQIVVLLPLLIYISLILFYGGLVVLLLSIHPPSAIAIAVVIGAGAVLYTTTLSLSILDASAPFKCPISCVGALIFRRLWPSLDHLYVRWIYFSPPFPIPRRIFVLVAKMLLWKPHTDIDLVNFDQSHPLTLDRYLITRLASKTATDVLDTIHNLPPSTASRLPDVHHSLVIAAGDPMHRSIVNMPSPLLKSFIGRSTSLGEARTIATLIAHQNQNLQYADEIGGAVIPLLKSSSNHWDKILVIVVSMRTAGHDNAGDLADLTISALKHERFTVSQISMIFNSISLVPLDSLPAWEDESRMVAATRISTALVTYHELSIVELAFVFANFEALRRTPSRPTEDGPCNGKIFSPYLRDDSAIIDMFLLLDSFPSFIHDLGKRSNLSGASSAFAIHFLIRLGYASPIVYWRIMGRLSDQIVREWAREVTEAHSRAAAHIILHSKGINVGGHLDLTRKALSDTEIQRYDQSIDPDAVLDLDRPLLHAIFQEAESRRHEDWLPRLNKPSFAIRNVWLAIHAQTADPAQRLRIPVERIEWIDHPISEMIALRRLSAYDDGSAEPDPAFIKLFLRSRSFNVLLPIFQRQLSCLHTLNANEHASISAASQVSRHGPFDLLPNALSVLLGPDLAPDQLSSFWMLVYDTRWEKLPKFVPSFFSITDREPGAAPEYVGIKWMEAVWDKVLRPRIREVVIEAPRLPWPGVNEGEWDRDGKAISYQRLRARAREEEGEQKEMEEQMLDESMTRVLETLATLLKVAGVHGLVDVGVANAVSRSSLLADDRLRRDRRSLGFIEAIIRPLLVPLPPVEDTQSPEVSTSTF